MSRKPLNLLSKRYRRSLAEQQYLQLLRHESPTLMDYSHVQETECVEGQNNSSTLEDAFQVPLFNDEVVCDSSAWCNTSELINNNCNEHFAENVQNDNVDILSELKKWALTENITAKATNSLLLILRKYFKDLPADSRTLLSTPRSTSLRVVQPGVYYHFGLKNCLFHFLNSNTDFSKSNIDIVFNTDGLPLSKSSGSQLWPILGSVVGFKQVFVIGLFHSFSSKPNDASDYLSDFVKEAKLLDEEGLVFKLEMYACQIKMFVADTPAKVFALCVKNHSGYSSCTKCCSKGEFTNHRICFPDVDSLLRTDESFIEKTDDDYHRGDSLLIQIPNFGPVTNVPLDYMHLVCLGVVKKLIHLWFNGPLNVRMRSTTEQEISKNICKIRVSTPVEFQRKPRALNEYKYWIAVEFRSFLLYIGPSVLRNKIPANIYHHFLTLHMAITILCGKELSEGLVSFAEELLKHFVLSYKIIYGVHNISHNVHGLVHLGADCKKYDSLDTFSAFRFENHMQQLLKLVRTYNRHIQQVIRRLSEVGDKLILDTKKSIGVMMWTQHHNGPLPSSCHSPQFKKVIINDLTFTAQNSKNNCCLTRDGSFVVIENFAYRSGKLSIIGKQFLCKADLYEYSCKSSYFNIFELSNLSTELQIWEIETMINKIYLYENQDGKFAAFPMLHNEIGDKQNTHYIIVVTKPTIL